MRRSCILALAALVAYPALASAQESPALPHARVSITPFVGARVPFRMDRTLVFSAPGEEERMVFVAEDERGGGAAVGGEVDVRVWGPLGVSGSVLYSGAANRYVTFLDEEDEVQQQIWAGPSVTFARVSVSYRLPDPDPDRRRFHPAGFLMAGPAVVREQFSDVSDLTGVRDEAVNNFAIAVGVKAVQAIAPNVAFQLGFEDYITPWNVAERERRGDAAFGGTGVLAESEFTYSRSNIFVLHAGLALRF